MKSFLKSKTFWSNAVIAVAPALAALDPGVKEAICTSKNPGILVSLIGVLNIYLRFKSEEKITMKKTPALALVFAVLFMSACSTTPQVLKTDVFYKRDLPFCIEGLTCYEGTAVIPKQDNYVFEVAPKGDAKVDLLIVDTCHRETTQEGPPETVLDFFKNIFGKSAKGYKFNYRPVTGIEDDGDCSIRINTLEKNKGRHAWAVVRAEHERYKLPISLHCNGSILETIGVSICQSKAGLTQQMRFSEKVMIEADKGCELPHKKADGAYEWKISLGECGYTIRGESGKIHDMLTIGFEGLLVRNN